MIQLTWVQKYEKTINISLDMFNFFDSYRYTRLCIHFYWISHSNIKYINFEYIILASQKFWWRSAIVSNIHYHMLI